MGTMMEKDGMMEKCSQCGVSGCGHCHCRCMCHKTIPLLMVLFGLLFLGGIWGWWSAATVAVVWPVLVIIAGLKKMFAARCKCC